MQIKRLFLNTCFVGCLVSLKAQHTLTPQDAGSKVHFMIKNFGIKTGGDFAGLRGSVHFDPASPSTSLFDVTVNAGTVDTDNSTRDNHLKKDDYFDVERYPVIHLQSTQVQATTKPNRYIFTGKLTIKSITKAITFPFMVTAKDGGYLFTSDAFEINRRDFKVGSSSISLADELKLTLNVFAK